jgi:hypothetical protein
MWCGRSESQAAAAMRRRGHVARALVFEEATPIRAQGERGASGSEGAARAGGGGGDGGGCEARAVAREEVRTPREQRLRLEQAAAARETQRLHDEQLLNELQRRIAVLERTLHEPSQPCAEAEAAAAAAWEAKLAAEALRKQQQQRQADRAAEEAAEAELAAAKAAALAEARRAERERLDAESGALQAKAQEPVEAMDGYSDFAAAIGGGGGGDGGDRGGDEQVPSPRQRYRSRYRAGSSVMGDDEIFGGDGGSLIPAERRTLGRMLRPSRLLDSDAGLRDELPGAQAVVAAVPPPEQNCLDDSESTLQRFRTQLDTAREAVGLAVRTLVGPELRA